jgi:UDP-N-acetylmuramoylalanine--D-glutamate ligase
VYFSPEGRVDDGFMVDGQWIVKRTATGSALMDAPGSIQRLIPITAVELTGRHMLGNVVASAAVASVAGVSTRAMVDALRGFRGLAHVMEPAGEIDGVRFVNDSKATNVEAAKRSIESFDRNVVALIGGKFKGGNLRELAEPLGARGRAVVAIGEAAALVREALAGVVPVFEAGSMRQAVEVGYAAAKPDGVVLLAPACASFDWFRDYAARGDAFKQEVERLSSLQAPRTALRETSSPNGDARAPESGGESKDR